MLSAVNNNHMSDVDKMASQTPAVELSWKDVSFQVPNSRTDIKAMKAEYRKQGVSDKPPTHKTILENVSGRLAPGSFTAIMGASGSGKTTLLNYLSNRRYYLQRVKCSGKVYLNGNNREKFDFNVFVAYVMQDDVLIECMTVREILTFTSKLRLTPETAQKRMDQVVEQLELAKILDSRVGGQLARGISGGERKRVAIAMEILTDPLVLFLDEPTTGLDSYNAENVVEVCKHLAGLGKTVCCTIHQPNSYIFSMFQNLIVLADKKMVYSGSAQDSVEYFGKQGFPCPEFSNPAEHIIGVLSEKKNADQFPAIQDLEPIKEEPMPQHSEIYNAGFFKELGFLIKRSYLNYVRNKLMMQFKIMAKLMFIFIFLTCFWQNANGTSERSVTDRAGFIAFFLTSTSFDAVSTVGAYYDEKAQYVREQANRTYSPFAYYLSKFVSELPLDIFMSVIYMAIIYAGVGLSFDTAKQIFIFLFINVIIFINGKGWCNMLLFAFEHIASAAAVMPFSMVLQMLFGGFFINYANIPKYLYEFEYISIFKYTWSASMINEFNTFDRSACGGSPQCDAVNFYNIELSLWGNVGVAIGLTVIIHFIAFYVLYKLSMKFRS